MFCVLSNKCCVLCTVAITEALSNTPQWRPGAGRVCGRHSGVSASRLQSADASLCLTGRGLAAPPKLVIGMRLSLTLRLVKDIYVAVLLPALKGRLKQLAITGEQRQHITLVIMAVTLEITLGVQIEIGARAISTWAAFPLLRYLNAMVGTFKHA